MIIIMRIGKRKKKTAMENTIGTRGCADDVDGWKTIKKREKLLGDSFLTYTQQQLLISPFPHSSLLLYIILDSMNLLQIANISNITSRYVLPSPMSAVFVLDNSHRCRLSQRRTRSHPHHPAY
jgi:hypothetical protein